MKTKKGQKKVAKKKVQTAPQPTTIVFSQENSREFVIASRRWSPSHGLVLLARIVGAGSSPTGRFPMYVASVTPAFCSPLDKFNVGEGLKHARKRQTKTGGMVIRVRIGINILKAFTLSLRDRCLKEQGMRAEWGVPDAVRQWFRRTAKAA